MPVRDAARMLRNITPGALDEAAQRYRDARTPFESETQARSKLEMGSGFVRAEIVAVTVPDEHHVLLRLGLAPGDVSLEAPLELKSLTINGSRVDGIEIQSPRASVGADGQPNFEFMIWGQVEPVLARELRSASSLYLEGALPDGRVLSALRAAK